MATLASSPRTNRLTALSATTGPFPLEFRLFDSDGLTVFVDGVATTAWTVSANMLDGFDDDASITFLAPVALGAVVQIDGALQPRRDLDYVNGDPNLTIALNNELGRLWSAVSETKTQVGRTLRGLDDIDPLPVLDPAQIAIIPELVDEAEGYAAEAAASAAIALEKEASMIADAGAWVSGTVYRKGDLLTFAGETYLVQVNHTSSQFIDIDVTSGSIRLFAARGIAGSGSGDSLNADNLAGLTNKPLAYTTIGGKALGKLDTLPFANLDPAAVITHGKGLKVNRVANAVPTAKAVTDYVTGLVNPLEAIANSGNAAGLTVINFLNLDGWDQIELVGQLLGTGFPTIQVSPDNGVTWRTAGYLSWTEADVGGSAFTTGMMLTRASAPFTVFINVQMQNLASPIFNTAYFSDLLLQPAVKRVSGVGVYNTPEICTAIRINGATFTAGAVVVHGVRRAFVPDTVAPLLSSTAPISAATDVAVLTSPVLTFNEEVAFGTGLVTLRQLIGAVWSDLETFDVATEVGTGNGQISIDGSSVVLNPTAPLVAGRTYAVRVASTAIDDLAGNSFAGIANDSTFIFTTAIQEAPAILFLSVDNATVNHILSAAGTIHWSVDDEVLRTGVQIDAGTGAYAFGNFAATDVLTETILDLTGVPPGVRRIHFVATSTGDVNYGNPQHFTTTVVIVGAPVNTAPPVIPAGAIPGDVLTMTGFAFTGSGLTYTYRWLLNGTPIVGQTAASYTVLAADVSDVIIGQVKATDGVGRASDWISSNDIIPGLAPIVISAQPLLNAAIYVVGATATLTLAVANATVGISEFSLNGVDMRSELVQISATQFTWNSTGKAPGAIGFQCIASNASQTLLSNRITATLNAGSITVPLIMASGDWTHVNEGSGGILTTTIITAPGNGGSAITGYDIQKDGVTTISLGRSTPGSAVTSGHSLTVSGSYLIRAVNSAGNGPWSVTPKVVTASDIVAPETVSFLYDTPTNAATITRSESSKTYYLVNSTASVLSGPNIKSQVLAGTPAVFGQINIGTPEVTPNLAALGAAGTFVLHQALEDASGNVEPFGQFIEFDWPGGTDLVAPVLSLPVDNASGSSASTGSVTTDKSGGTLSVVDSLSATAPSAAQIEAGQMHTGAAAASFTSYAVGATGVQPVASIGLTAVTNYFKHFVQRSASGVISNVVSGDGFTTAAASADVEFVSSTLMISTTATGDGPAYVSATDHVVSAQANRVVVLMLRGTWDTVGPPTIDATTFGGVAATVLQQPIGTGGRSWCAIIIALLPATGARGCTITLSATQRAFSVEAVECKNVNQTTPSEAVGSVSTNLAATLSFSRTTVTNGNKLLSALCIDTGGYQADITAISGATLVRASQTGTTSSSDHSSGVAREAVPTAGANGHGYNWVTSDSAVLSWVELARA